mmetsp:Transcript_18677/g.22814  ORF Transcript_18677/g.22814 Transcript_18677/m.22814 type:complete len:118 (+) Transcript_18677:826-1179(+)
MFEKICSHWGIFIPNFLFDADHYRELLFIVGFRDPEHYKAFDFDFPVVETKDINLFLEPEVIYTDRFKSYPEIKQGVVKHINTNTVYQWRRTYVRENKGKCSLVGEEGEKRIEILHI